MRRPFSARVGVVLGSGLGGLGRASRPMKMPLPAEVGLADGQAGATGHRGVRLVLETAASELSGRRRRGRAPRAWEQSLVVFGVRVLGRLGARALRLPWRQTVGAIAEYRPGSPPTSWTTSTSWARRLFVSRRRGARARVPGPHDAYDPDLGSSPRRRRPAQHRSLGRVRGDHRAVRAGGGGVHAPASDLAGMSTVPEPWRPVVGSAARSCGGATWRRDGSIGGAGSPSEAANTTPVSYEARRRLRPDGDADASRCRRGAPLAISRPSTACSPGEGFPDRGRRRAARRGGNMARRCWCPGTALTPRAGGSDPGAARRRRAPRAEGGVHLAGCDPRTSSTRPRHGRHRQRAGRGGRRRLGGVRPQRRLPWIAPGPSGTAPLRLAGADAALVVDDDAAAVLLTLRRWPRVAASRRSGELVGVKASRSDRRWRPARQVEAPAGHVRRATACASTGTGAILGSTESNFRVVGFTERPPLSSSLEAQAWPSARGRPGSQHSRQLMKRARRKPAAARSSFCFSSRVADVGGAQGEGVVVLEPAELVDELHPLRRRASPGQAPAWPRWSLSTHPGPERGSITHFSMKQCVSLLLCTSAS